MTVVGYHVPMVDASLLDGGVTAIMTAWISLMRPTAQHDAVLRSMCVTTIGVFLVSGAVTIIETAMTDQMNRTAMVK